MVQRALLARVQVTAHRMPAERGAAEEYERLVRERVEAREDGLPAFDLMLLGLGKDGHTASLFPGTKALDEQERLVVMIDVPQLEARRMTFTYTLINAAMRVWVLATGGDKAAIVRQCLEEQQDPKAPRQWPVLGVRPKRGELIWWLDRASAGQSEICRGPR
jgi:6-phosphogluconolactonase